MKDPRSTPPADTAAEVFPRSGELGPRCRGLDWARTPLGPVENWSQSLRTAAGMVIASPSPMVLLWGPALVQIYNDACRDVLGGNHPAGLGQPTHEAWPEARALTEAVHERVLNGGESLSFEDQPLRVNRSGALEEAFFTLGYSPVRDDDGSIGGVLVTIVETTEKVLCREAERERAEAAAALNESEARYRALAELSPDAMVVDLDGRWVYANPAAARLLAAETPEALIGRSPFDIIAPDYHERVRARIRRVVEEGRRTPPIEYTWRRLDGTTVRVEGATAPTVWNGRPAVQVVARDLGARIRREEALRESEGRLRSVLESSRDVAYRRDLRTDAYDYLSPAVGDVLGIEADQLEAMTVEALMERIHPDDREPVTAAIETGMRVRQGTAEYRFRGNDGRFRWVADHFTVQVDDRGTPISRTGIVRDVTERVVREQALRQARDQAREANRAKSQFLSTMSHELRTPLNAVIGLADLLEAEVLGSLNGKQKDSLGRIRSSAWHLVGIIEEILTFSRSEAGKEKVTLAEVDLARIARDVRAMLDSDGHAGTIEFRLHGTDQPVLATTDARKVKQILTNLVGNAIKFSGDGAVDLELTTNGRWIDLTVRDTGPGIPLERVEEIFEPFVQLDASTTREGGGTGLGLAIALRQARLLGGDIRVDSEVGVGSTFVLRLPRSPAGHDGAAGAR
ncbi:MAG: PAS domain-containing sensor histidine kinase [Gemmatimonadota bacterium]